MASGIGPAKVAESGDSLRAAQNMKLLLHQAADIVEAALQDARTHQLLFDADTTLLSQDGIDDKRSRVLEANATVLRMHEYLMGLKDIIAVAKSESEVPWRSRGAYPSGVDSSHRAVGGGMEGRNYSDGMEAVAWEEEKMSSAAARSATRLQNLEEQSTKLKEDLAKAMQSLNTPPASGGSGGAGGRGVAAQAGHVAVQREAAALPAMSPKEFPEESAPIAQPSSSPKKRTYVNPRSQLQIGGYSPVLDAAHDAGPGGGAGGAGAVQIGTDRAAEEYGGATRKDDAYAPRGERSGAEQGRDSPHPLDVDVAWIQKLAAAYSPRPRPEHPEFAKIMTLPPLEYLELPAAMVHVASGIANASTHLLTGANPGGKRGVFSAPEAPRPGGDQRALQARSNVAGQRPGTGVHTNGGREAGRRVVVAPAAPAVLSPRDFVSSPSPRRRHTAPMDFDGGVNSMPSVSVQGRPNDATPAARPEPRAEKHLSPPHPNRALSPLNMHRPHDATHHRASGGMLTDPPRDVRDQRDRGSQQSQPHGDRGSQQSQVHVYPSAGSHYHAPAPVPYSSNHYPASYSHGSSSHGQYTSAGQQGYAGLVSPVFSGVASPHFGGVVSPHGGGVSSRGGADMSPMRQTGSYSMAMAAAPRRGGGTVDIGAEVDPWKLANPMASPSSTYVGNHAVSHLSPAQHSLMSPRQPLGGGHSNPYTVSNHGLAAAMSPRMGGQQQNQYASPYYSVGSAGPRNAVSPFMSRVVGSGR